MIGRSTPRLRERRGGLDSQLERQSNGAILVAGLGIPGRPGVMKNSGARFVSSGFVLYEPGRVLVRLNINKSRAGK
jgi:hypothetical protein